MISGSICKSVLRQSGDEVNKISVRNLSFLRRKMLMLGTFHAFWLIVHAVWIMAQEVPPSLDFIGSRRPGTTCTFNPCTIPNFCGQGRSCEIDDNCVSRCECLEQSEHPDCVSGTDDKQSGENNDTTLGNQLFVKPATSRTSELSGCRSDPCDTLSWMCDGGRKCVTRACILHCDCTPESTHNLCVENEQSDTNSSDECGGFSGMKCKHGSCVQIGSAFSCQCDANWKGALCDQHASTGCTRACAQGYECTWYMDTMQICAPKILKEEEREDKFMNQENSTNSTISLNACSDEYMLHPISERNCSDGLQCLYGVCQRNNADRDEYICLCDMGAFGPNCNQTCCRDCGVGGECHVDGYQGEEKCHCFSNYIGSNCTELLAPESESRWYLWVVGSCAIVLIILVILVVLIPYLLWKHRVILVMKVVHYFQGYEDDDGREWDAFISYKSNPKDEAFVTRVLFPKLDEEFGFKLNVHYRDFIPGDTIANNIIRVVKGSRRTILIITPEYIKGEHTKMEYQVVQQQMLKQKHRIIPILLEDISDCKEALDPNLKLILKSVTYLEWPSDNSDKRIGKFWKRLFLSLPKKRKTNRNILPDTCGVGDSFGKEVPHRTFGRPEENGVPVTQIQLESEYDHYDNIQEMNRF